MTKRKQERLGSKQKRTDVDAGVLTAREKQAFRAIRADPEARKSFEFLARKTGATFAELTTYFVIEAWSSLKPEPSGASKDINSLRSLATKLETLASRVQKANELSTWRFAVPRVDICDIRGRESLGKAFKELPELMRSYTRNMSLKIKAIAESAESPKALQLEYSKSLVRWIKSKTGHRYGDHVAAVQRVTYREAGRKVAPASGETLRKRERRSRKT